MDPKRESERERNGIIKQRKRDGGDQNEQEGTKSIIHIKWQKII